MPAKSEFGRGFYTIKPDGCFSPYTSVPAPPRRLSMAPPDHLTDLVVPEQFRGTEIDDSSSASADGDLVTSPGAPIGDQRVGELSAGGRGVSSPAEGSVSPFFKKTPPGGYFPGGGGFPGPPEVSPGNLNPEPNPPLGGGFNLTPPKRGNPPLSGTPGPPGGGENGFKTRGTPFRGKPGGGVTGVPPPPPPPPRGFFLNPPPPGGGVFTPRGGGGKTPPGGPPPGFTGGPPPGETGLPPPGVFPPRGSPPKTGGTPVNRFYRGTPRGFYPPRGFFLPPPPPPPPPGKPV